MEEGGGRGGERGLRECFFFPPPFVKKAHTHRAHGFLITSLVRLSLSFPPHSPTTGGALSTPPTPTPPSSILTIWAGLSSPVDGSSMASAPLS